MECGGVYRALENWKNGNKCFNGHGITENYSDYLKVQGTADISETLSSYARTIASEKYYLFRF